MVWDEPKERPLKDIIHQIWKEGNMPPSKKQDKSLFESATETFPPATLSFNGDILGGGVIANTITNTKKNVAVFGKNGVGKTTLACQGEGLIALLAIDPSPTGGALSVAKKDNVMVYTIAAKYLPEMSGGRPTGRLETTKGSQKVMGIVDAIQKRSQAGPCPFKKVVIDGLSSWDQVLLSEVLNVDYNNMPGILGLGKVTGDQYTERSERMIRYLRPIFELPCDVWILAQERDHNPPKDKSTTRSGKQYERPSQTRLMAEAHPASQEGSWWSFAIGDSVCLYMQNSCDFTMQLYEDHEWKEEKGADIIFDGQTIPGQIQMVPTGRQVKRLRCQFHPNYAGRMRGDYRVIPQYIEAPTPELRYQAFIDVAEGRRTKWGYYPKEG